MKYLSTRDDSLSIEASEAITRGLSREGGLFVPEEFPQYSQEDLRALLPLSYPERAASIMKHFLTEFTYEELLERARAAYSAEKFGSENPIPITTIEENGVPVHVLELWHGPTCAFKDMALQMLPHLLTLSLEKSHPGATALILTATSGDTGKAALEGFRDVPGVRILVFYPQNGVSEMQKLQMITQEGDNVGVCAIEGNFDDAQTGVKRIFTSEKMNTLLEQHHFLFSSANSINWGRLLSQIVYYFSAYLDLVKENRILLGDPINICVPTGNFGNILAAYYAFQMGLPVGRFICASNSNDVLTQFLNEGVYDRKRVFYETISPSMDILISSNLERLLYDLTVTKNVRDWMQKLTKDGVYTVDRDTAMRLHALFYASRATEEETKAEIRRVWEENGYLIDPHTAVGSKVCRDYLEYTGDYDTPILLASTASPYKFASSVLSAIASEEIPEGFEAVRALSRKTNTVIPAPLAALEGKKVRFPDCCRAENMDAVVCSMAGIELP